MDPEKNNVWQKHLETQIFQYNNESDVSYILKLKNDALSIPRINFYDKNVLYMFGLPIKTNHHCILVKIGSTNNFTQKHSKLEFEYYCKMHLIGIKFIRDQNTERKLHELLRTFFPENTEKIIIDGKKKKGVYKFSIPLLIQFNNI